MKPDSGFTVFNPYPDLEQPQANGLELGSGIGRSRQADAAQIVHYDVGG